MPSNNKDIEKLFQTLKILEEQQLQEILKTENIYEDDNITEIIWLTQDSV